MKFRDAIASQETDYIAAPTLNIDGGNWMR